MRTPLSVLLPLILLVPACSIFREVPPRSGAALTAAERTRSTVERELFVQGVRTVDLIAAAERCSADVVKLLRELEVEPSGKVWRVALPPTVNESGLPAASFAPLDRGYTRALILGAWRRGMQLIPIASGERPGPRDVDAILTRRMVGSAGFHDGLTLGYGITRTRVPR